MDVEFWNKVNEVFTAAIELEEDERRKYLDEQLQNDPKVRAKVEQMLLADNADETISEPLINLADFLSKERLEDLVGQKIDNYQILCEIGRGGMGVVFEAIYEAEGVTQRVALKILKSHIDTKDMLRRFGNERKILASLEHRNIVRLLNAGKTSEDIPFYTMELVNGKPIDEFVEEGNLNIEELLNLFLQICAAVSYAHSKLIIHRDLKPNNILVTPEGVVKLLDFGIAKVLSPDTVSKGTATQFGIMTPRYASPEQIRGEIVLVASDVYSLGVILYELLTGVLPYRITTESPLEIAKIINSVEPPKPSDAVSEQRTGDEKVNTQFQIKYPNLKGDLDTIILKALQKEPSRRYGSVEQLANDISLYLKGKPISARPDTFTYRIGKFIKRNQILVAATSLILLAIFSGTGIAVWQAVKAEKQRDLAEKHFNSVQELADKVVFRYHDEVAKLPGSTALREELVGDALKYLDALSADEIADDSVMLKAAKAYRKIADVQGHPTDANLGKASDAIVSLQKSIDIFEKLAAGSPDNYEVKRELGFSYIKMAGMKKRQLGVDVSDLFEKVEKIYQEINPLDEKGKTANTLLLAHAYSIEAEVIPDDINKKRELFQKISDMLEGISEKTPEIDARINRNHFLMGANYTELGDTASKNGENEKAEEFYNLALNLLQKVVEKLRIEFEQKKSPLITRYLALNLEDLGGVLVRLGRIEEGFEKIYESRSLYVKMSQTDPNNVRSMFDIANVDGTIADLYKRTNNPQKFIEYKLKSAEGYEKIDPDKRIAAMYSRHSLVLQDLIKFYETSDNLTESQKYKNKLANICQNEKAEAACRQIDLNK